MDTLSEVRFKDCIAYPSGAQSRPAGRAASIRPAFPAPVTRDILSHMNEFLSLGCPFCGEPVPVDPDPLLGDEDLIIDCENCCRPMRIVTRWVDDGDEPHPIVEIQPG
jgi:hypothetical protein